MKKKFLRRKGFSLIELSVVVTILSILIAGALSIAANMSNQKKVKDTTSNLKEIERALDHYVKIYKKLPCPASLIYAKADNDEYGKAANGGDCNLSGVYQSLTHSALVYGMVPVQDLHLPLDMAQDSFGNKIVYIVNRKLTTSETFSDDITTSMTVASYTGDSDNDQTYTQQAVYILMSSGNNQSGAFAVNAVAKNSISGDTQEAENYVVPSTDSTGSYDEKFYASVNSNTDTFDDIVIYGTRDDLIVRSGAYDLMDCGVYNSTLSYDQITYHTWSSGKYGQVVPSDVACPEGWQETVKYPTKRCGPLGKWESGVVNACIYSALYEEPPAEENIGTISCSGGTISNAGSYQVHVFNESGSLICSGSGILEYLIVGAGGGGGGIITTEGGMGGTEYGGAGGGGGGGVTTGQHVVESGETIAITVGTGGLGGSATDGSAGTASFFGSYNSATGGSGGLQGGLGDNGYGGASGSGDSAAKSGGAPQAVDGDHSAGGGGASMESAGGNGQTVAHAPHAAGNGADGTSNNITGSNIIYGGGGGGGAGGGNSEGTAGTGGAGGGGAGGHESIIPQNGVANRGGGGGGGSKAGAGGDGGAGVVIVRYSISAESGGDDPCVGGTITHIAGKTIHTFTNSGLLSCSEAVSNVAYLVVGAGGGGGGIIPVVGGMKGDKYGGAGGGGGGGVSTGTHNVGVESLTITVGTGGLGGLGSNGADGASSSVSGSLSVTSTGGAGGLYGPDQDAIEDNDGGHGGASGVGNTSSVAGGLAWDRAHKHGAGGGGSSMANAGGDVEPTGEDHAGGAGGNGTSSSISGSAYFYGSGGGGGAGEDSSQGTPGVGGANSGGTGGGQTTAATDGVNGGGGGGGSKAGSGGDGGDGVVIFSYTTP